jgi:hypothetical protein
MRSLSVALAVIATVAVAGCGGSNDTKTATTPGKPTALTRAQADRLDKGTQDVVSAVPLFRSKIGRCVARKRGRGSCVRTAVGPAEASVAGSRKEIDTLKEQVGGGCANALSAARERLTTLTDDLSSMTQSALQGSFRTVTRVGANVQSDLAAFAQTATASRQSCTA